MTKSTHSLNPSPLRVLVVDDSTNLRQVIIRYLQMGFKDMLFFEAENGDVAEAILQEGEVLDEHIDIVFLDWMMPKVSGFEFLKRIRDTEAFKSHPDVVMLTAETYSAQINACMKYGVSTYIMKPFTAEELIASVQKILDERGLRNAV